MSIFNEVVPLHGLAPFLKFGIRWAVPDLENRYPLEGRLRYLWMGDNSQTIKLLLKDGPDSWSEQKEAITAQLERHESLISFKTYEKDPVYLIAEFEPLKTFEWIPKEAQFYLPVSKIFVNAREVVAATLDRVTRGEEPSGEISILQDPFDIFHDRVKFMGELQKQGIDTPAAHLIKTKVQEALKKAEDSGDNTQEIYI